MGRPRKKQHRQPSIIDSEHDHRFSESASGSSSDSDSSLSSQDIVQNFQPIVAQPQAVVRQPVAIVPPPVIPQKRAKSGRTSTPRTSIPTPTVSQVVNYAVSVLTSAEMKKGVSKRVPKCSSFQLRTDEPWDTVKAQLLVKVSNAIGDGVLLDVSKFNFMVSISRVISKPGVPLISDNDYDLFLTKIKLGKLKEPILANVSITQLDGVDDKENEPAANDKTKKKGGRKDPDTLPGNVEKTNNIQMLQQRWKCDKRQNNCIGVYCYIDREGNHLSLSHQRLDCWASAMVCLNIYYTLF
jgi:hypothetical protein